MKYIRDRGSYVKKTFPLPWTGVFFLLATTFYIIFGAYFIRYHGVLLGKRPVKTPSVFIAVFSRPENFQARQTVRHTYGSYEVQRKYGIILRFFMGETQNKVDIDIREEASVYKDLVSLPLVESRGSMQDKYRLTVERMLEDYTELKYFIKTEDDVLLNIFSILDYINTNLTTTDWNIHCSYRLASSVDDGSNRSVGTTNGFFKPYCIGTFILFRTELLSNFHDALHEAKPKIRQDDVYLYGVARQWAGFGLKPLNWYDSFNSFNIRAFLDGDIMFARLSGAMATRRKEVAWQKLIIKEGLR